VYQPIGNAFPVRKSTPSASKPSARQPPRRMGHCAASAKQGHHGGMMRCGGGVKEDGIAAGGDYSNIMRTRTSINDGGRHCPTAATGPHSRLLIMQQSTNILCDRTTLLKLEKLSLVMLISYSKSQRVDESSSVMFAGCDGHTILTCNFATEEATSLDNEAHAIDPSVFLPWARRTLPW
jgi:hypothetical protein